MKITEKSKEKNKKTITTTAVDRKETKQKPYNFRSF